jgi:MraZ protein
MALLFFNIGCGIFKVCCGIMWYNERRRPIFETIPARGKRMFWGEFSHHLDKKGRLIIPARYRPHLEEGAILTRGLDRNLVIYPNETWRTVSEQLNQMPITHPTSRALRRLMFSGVVELALDRQGRILVPGYLREYASLDSPALIIGMETFIEIWEPTLWRTALDGVSNTLAEAEHLLTLSL